MEEQKISFETAKLAKEKGFKLHPLDMGFHYYKPNGEILKIGEWNQEFAKFCFEYCTQSVLQKWLREIHNCHVEARFHNLSDDSLITKENLGYCVEINYYGKNFDIPLTDKEDFLAWDFETYEEALEVGLFEGLKLIKDEKRNN